MNYKNLLLSVVSVLIVLFSVSCSMTVAVKTLVPSEVDMSQYRTVAVEKTRIEDGKYYDASVRYSDGVTYDGMLTYSTDKNFPSYTAEAAGKMIADSLKESGYFGIALPDDTEYLIRHAGSKSKLETLAENDIDAVLSSSITELSWDEYVYSEPVYTRGFNNLDGIYSNVIAQYRYILCQKLSMTVMVTLTDTKTGRVIVSRNYSDSLNRETVLYGGSFGVPDLGRYAESMLSGFAREVTSLLAPHYVITDVELYENRPSDGRATQAYQLVSDGNLESALDIFLECWKDSHVPSGYNAAVILQAMGRYDKAMNQINSVVKETGDRKAEKLMKAFIKDEKKRTNAVKQITDAVSVQEIKDKS